MLMADPRPATPPATSRSSLARWWPLAALILGLGLFLALRLDRYVSFAALKEHRTLLLDLVDRHFAVSAAAFTLIYMVSVAFSLPIATLLTVSAGFLFGTWVGMILSDIGATAGGVILFLAAKSAFGDILRRRAGPWLARMQKGFQDNAFYYLLMLRLIPVFPLFVVNLVPAFLGIRLRDYVLATLIGIVPGSFVFASVGAGLGSVFDAGGEFSAKGILTPQVIVALLGLACLALVPVVYKTFKKPS